MNSPIDDQELSGTNLARLRANCLFHFAASSNPSFDTGFGHLRLLVVLTPVVNPHRMIERLHTQFSLRIRHHLLHKLRIRYLHACVSHFHRVRVFDIFSAGWQERCEGAGMGGPSVQRVGGRLGYGHLCGILSVVLLRGWIGLEWLRMVSQMNSGQLDEKFPE